MKTQKRKLDHIRVCLEKDVQFRKGNGFADYELRHNALPEMDFSDVDTRMKFLGREFKAPIFIEAMTGGTSEAEKINRNLAKAAEALGIGMGLGSQRAMIEDPSLTRTYSVRDVAPSILLLGNIGASQILQTDAVKIKEALVATRADGLAVHLNAAQEIAQDSGEEKWKGVLESIRVLSSGLGVPVVVKEVGNGIGGDVAKRLEKAGVAAIDVAGAGGTSWVKVDALITGKSMESFSEWGIPTAQCLEECVRSVKVPVIASGGIRNGVDVAKAISMGAFMAGMALPLLRPATVSAEAVKARLEKTIEELRVAMFLSGSRNLAELRGKAFKI